MKNVYHKLKTKTETKQKQTKQNKTKKNQNQLPIHPFFSNYRFILDRQTCRENLR